MYIPRLLVSFFLVALGVVPLVAQSSTENSRAFSQPESLQFGAPLLSAPLLTQDGIDVGRFQTPALLGDLSAPDAAGANEDEFNLTPQRLLRGLRSPVLAEDDSTCYFIRSYRVTRDDPKSDTTRPAGYSTCLSASRLQMRSAVGR
jgi:hypothetical protein